MGVGLWVLADYPAHSAPENLIDQLHNWFENDLTSLSPWGNLSIQSRIGTTHDGHPALFVILHPAAEELALHASSPGRLVVSAKTSTVGPGYHIALCQSLFGNYSWENQRGRWPGGRSRRILRRKGV